MAQNKGFLYRLTMGSDTKPDFQPSQLPSTRWQQFWDIFRLRMGALIKINLVSVLFLVPLAAVILIKFLTASVLGTLLPFSANIGVGYPPATNTVELAQAVMFRLDVSTFVLYVPLVALASIGLSGAFVVTKKLAWGEGVAVLATYFRGIKDNFWHFALLGLLFGFSLVLMLFNFAVMDLAGLNPFWMWLSAILNIIQFVLTLGVLLFATTQTVTYQLKFWHLLKNSFLFAVGTLPLTLFFLLVSLVPVYLLYQLAISVQFLTVICLFFFLLFGVAFVVLVWTLYAHFAFDRFVNDRVVGMAKNRGLYVQTPEERAVAEEQRRRKVQPPRYANPKKRRSTVSVGQGATLTPLATSFSRSDLQRLAREKADLEQEQDQLDAQLEEQDIPLDIQPDPTQD